MNRIIQSTEPHVSYARAISAGRGQTQNDADAIADTGAVLACSLKSRCLDVYSRSGATIRRVSARRPALPLIGSTKEERVSRQMALVWGAISVVE
ncbi:pyruvate kinase alpha/beta domain-containing protein [Loktanella sp. S4079]|uniref:pyruvate kinase alpha/beta domain-containing protein n=1 Tax=Loktanella sp. S4079 TaxID=579483 RepID=UPI0009FBB298|nr:pyruvate kinase alpha/beta domain-containing protein [Loktanella sp. S4079]